MAPLRAPKQSSVGPWFTAHRSQMPQAHGRALRVPTARELGHFELSSLPAGTMSHDKGRKVLHRAMRDSSGVLGAYTAAATASHVPNFAMTVCSDGSW